MPMSFRISSDLRFSLSLPYMSFRILCNHTISPRFMILLPLPDFVTNRGLLQYVWVYRKFVINGTDFVSKGSHTRPWPVGTKCCQIVAFMASTIVKQN